MAKFLNSVKIAPNGTQPMFINAPRIDTNEIKKAGTTGSEIMDTVYNGAMKIAQNLNELKRQNELADVKIQANKNLQDYELQWSEPYEETYIDENGQTKKRMATKNKFDNYKEYKAGLNAVYEQNKLLISNTSYTTEADVDSWDKAVSMDLNNANFKADGEQAEYEIKKEVDKSLLKIDGLKASYIATGNESDRLSILNIYDGMSSLMPQENIEVLKIKTLADMNMSRLEQELKYKLNNTNSIEDKMKEVKIFRDDLNNKEALDSKIKKYIEKGIVPAEYSEMYKDFVTKNIKDNMISSGGVLDQLQTQIRNEKYQNETRLELEKLKMENNILKAKNEIRVSMKTGDDFKVISTAEDREITGGELINETALTQKYYGKDPQDILWNKNDDSAIVNSTGNYIPTISEYQINQLKNSARVDSLNGIPRNKTVEGYYEKINTLDGNEKENLRREYKARGLVSPMEDGLMSGNITTSLDINDVINDANIGSNSGLNKTNDFAGIPNTKLGTKVNKLDYYQKHQLAEMIVGGVLNNRFGSAIDPKTITVGTIDQQYTNSPEVQKTIDEYINIIESIDKQKYKKINMKQDIQQLDRMIYEKYNKPIKIREKTKESGLQPKVKKYNTSFLDEE